MKDAKIDPRKIRRRLGLSQEVFWSTIGVTQCTGSRYERGVNMPRPARTLLLLVYGSGIAPLYGQGEDPKEISAETRLDPKELRCRLGASQLEFWSSIGMTQSAGSRYESGRSMPRTIQTLLRLVQAERIASAGDLRNRFQAG
ncbi:MAG: hypothetical protein HYU75_00355 [Betaproteobacteria bacterium]|nr:hypothetical protein [Betaproteobacteria bacterium]